MTKLLLIDGSSLLHRAFYALPLLTNGDGVYTNAVHGFMMMLNKAMAQLNPDKAAVAFDKSRHTFRTDMDPGYKATRSATPIELKGQFDLIKQILDLTGLTWLEEDNYEADDIIGALASRGKEAGYEVEILTGDRDLLQLVEEGITVFLTRKGITEVEPYDAAAVEERFGCPPARLIDLKGLMGDSSDNIPGVPGVGEKTAAKLLAQFGDIDSLYAHLDQVSGDKLREKLAANRESALLSRRLATICRDMPLSADVDQLNLTGGDPAALSQLYTKLGLRQLQRGLKQTAPVEPGLGVTPAAAEEKPWPEREEAASVAAPPAGDTGPAAPGLSQPLPARPTALGPEGCCCLLPAGNGLVLVLPGQAPLTLAPEEAADYCQPLEDPALPKLCWDAKAVAHILAPLRLAGLQDDALIAAYLLDPARGDYLLTDILSEQGLTADGPESQALALPACAARLRARLADCQMTALYEEMELPLTQILARMELAGVRVEPQRLADLSAELAASGAELQASIYQLAGHEFNLNSPKQLGVVLFEEMGIPPVKKTKTGYSTDSEVLESLAPMYDIARQLLDYRLVAKLHSTYTEGLAKLIGPDQRIHTRFTQTVTATGRLSSVEPNLQNIPVRQELGRRIRQVFTADSPDRLLLAADYNQVELRIMAHISGAEALKAAFLAGEDIHRRTAAEVLNVPPDQVTPEQRRAAKAVNFGIIYGISDYGLSRDLGVSRKQAADYIAAYFARYPQVADYQRRTILTAREQGYVETLFGRRRYLPDLINRNFNLRSLAERMAINAPIQGSAADIIKLAMVSLEPALEQSGLDAKLLLQVHDELILETSAADFDATAALVKDKMENAAQLSVPLTVEVKRGYDWYHMEKVR